MTTPHWIRASRRLLAALALVPVLLAGCGGSGNGEAADGSEETSSPSSSPTSGGPSTSPSPSPPSESGSPSRPPLTPVPPPTRSLPPLPQPPPAGVTVTLEGRVVAGVEAGCRVLETDKRGSYLLLGEPEDGEQVPLGARVRVTGTVADNIASYCQQGIPFTVVDVEPIE